MFLQGATYPLELLGDADRLAKEAARHLCQDGRQVTTPAERTFARSAIFTAFNFLESLLVELTQQCLATGSANATVQTEIEADLRKGNARISRTIKEWPAKLGKASVHGRAEFRAFCKLRRLRNNLTHPKLQPLEKTELTQDQLLQEANARNAAWAVAEVKKMGRALYSVFGVRVPPEVQEVPR
jgi:hypothetical protein